MTGNTELTMQVKRIGSKVTLLLLAFLALAASSAGTENKMKVSQMPAEQQQ